MYLALRELGRVVRTDVSAPLHGRPELRKRIDDQLDKLESTLAFARTVFYGQNGHISYAGKEE